MFLIHVPNPPPPLVFVYVVTDGLELAGALPKQCEGGLH